MLSCVFVLTSFFHTANVADIFAWYLRTTCRNGGDVLILNNESYVVHKRISRLSVVSYVHANDSAHEFLNISDKSPYFRYNIRSSPQKQCVSAVCSGELA